jgi:hypothetical protein
VDVLNYAPSSVPSLTEWHIKSTFPNARSFPLHPTPIPSTPTFSHLLPTPSRGRLTSPTNVLAPRDRRELQVCLDDLTLGGAVDGKQINAADRILVGAQVRDVPAPRDVVAVVEEVERVHLLDGRRVRDGLNVGLLAGEGGATELEGGWGEARLVKGSLGESVD